MKKALLTITALVSLVSADQMVKLNVTGMTCPACVKNVKESLGTVSGVKESTVYLKDGRAEVKTADTTKADDLCKAIKDAGYGCKVAK